MSSGEHLTALIHQAGQAESLCARAHTHTRWNAQAPTYSHSAVIDFSPLNTAQHQPVLLTAQAGRRGGGGGGGP